MKRYALVVGISRYENPGLPDLVKPAASAEAVAKLLEEYGNFHEVRRLPAHWLSSDRCEVGRTSLTEAELSAELKRLLKEQAVGGEVLIYFSGHGFVMSDNLDGSEAFLATSDTKIGIKNGRVTWQQNGIRLRSLGEQFASAEFSSLVMLLDCCHSGSLIESSVVQQALATSASQRDYSLIAACRGFEKAYEGETQELYSIFTTALLQGLSREQANQNGQVSSDRLFDYLSQALKGRGQEPIRLGLGRSIGIVSYPVQSQQVSAALNPANPYVGLTAFESEQADYFYGRDREVRELLLRLDPLQNPPRRFLAVIGPSGCGKSSLVKAGLLPALKNEGLPNSSQWQIEKITPGAFPKATLTEAIAKHANHQSYVLCIDQFEELFTLCQSEEEQREFLALLSQEATNAERQARVIITMRGDFLDRCARYQESADLINQTQPTTFIVTPLTDAKLAARLEEVIVKPAAMHGVTFEAGLVSQIISEVLNQLGAMPLLQYALMELWQTCITDAQSSPCLTWKGYEAIGGVKGALQRRADLLYGGLTASDKAFVRQLVMELVQVGDNGEVTRRRASWEDLRDLAPREQLERTIGQLTAQRLLVADKNMLEVAHESLLVEVPLIQSWIEESRDDIRQRDRFERNCREWLEQQQSEDYLLNPGKLAAVEEWTTKTQPVLSIAETKFLQKSQEKRDREHQAQLDQQRKLTEAAEARAEAETAKAQMETEKALEASKRIKLEKQRNSWLSATAVILVTLLAFTFKLQQEAERSRNLALQALISEPQKLFDTDNQLESMIASVQALEELEKIGGNAQAVRQLSSSVISKVREFGRLEKHQDAVIGVDFSPDGKKLVSSSKDGSVIVWDLQDGSTQSLQGSESRKGFWRARYSSLQGDLIAVTNLDNELNLWQASTGKSLKPLQSSDVPFDLAFSSDSQKIAVADWDGTIKIWNPKTGEALPEIRDYKGKERIISVDFSPNENSLVAGGYRDGTVKLWNLSTGKSKVVNQHHNRAMIVRFNANGQMLASGGEDGTINIWKKGYQPFSIQAHEKPVYGLAFSHDGSMLASASEDRTVKLWKVNNQKIDWVDTFTGHTGGVYSVSFSPKSDKYFLIASASEDTTVRLWRFSKNEPYKISENNISEVKLYGCEYVLNYLKSNENYLGKHQNLCNISD